jgi:hypothetical protein
MVNHVGYVCRGTRRVVTSSPALTCGPRNRSSGAPDAGCDDRVRPYAGERLKPQVYVRWRKAVARPELPQSTLPLPDVLPVSRQTCIITAPALNSATNCDLISSNKYGEN